MARFQKDQFELDGTFFWVVAVPTAYGNTNSGWSSVVYVDLCRALPTRAVNSIQH